MPEKNELQFNNLLKKYKQHFKNLKFKNTIQKDYLLKALYYSEGHLTAEKLTKELKTKYNVNISIATVYKILKLFEELKIVKCLNIIENAKFYELNFSNHNHLICNSCHMIIEFKDEIIEKKQLSIAKNNNYILKEHIITIYGLCPACQN
ncbi:transcriptional repressor [Arcobacter sp. KX21116]|jgi:Fur family ferric uptake transcriptional regulator|uniref:Fur family transcriptional regulator n=1 Tax=Arcobacter iocasae TaxID=2906515 RepID=UPI0035D4AED5|tara:strand:+ start:13655 stop:14104 length:450 start_codon:yes stop_codon:yes gene_type:complete